VTAGPTIDELLAEGNRREDAGDIDGAMRHYQQARAIDANHPRISLNVANALQKSGRFSEAARMLQHALTQTPESVAAHFNLGGVFVAQRRLVEAAQEYRTVLRLQPDLPEAEVMLAQVHDAEGRLDEAEQALRRALALRPDFAGAALNLGELFMRQHRYDEAEDWLRRAEAMDDSLATVHAALGSLYLKSGRHSEARSAYEAASARDPGRQVTGSSPLFALNFRSDVPAETVFDEHVRVGTHLTRTGGIPFTSWTCAAQSDRLLRIGYVSADFRKHPIGLFIRPVLALHDREHFEVHCYSNDASDDEITHDLRHKADHWHPIAGLDDVLVIERIRSDAIDVLVDLSGHTERNRLAVFARHPAPVQATWMGYLNTTGVRAMDYRICDAYTDPPGETERFNTERLQRLPHSQWCYAPYYDVPDVHTPHPDRPDGLVFGSFNQVSKITDATVALWSDVLRRVPEGELVIMDVPAGRARAALLDRFTREGVDASRITMHGRKDILSYFSAIGHVDIALDTTPYNGATTTLDTLWMGTPVVALRGQTGIARGGFSILSTLGLEELIAETPDAYVEANVRLAKDPAARSRLRTSLRTRLMASPLTDTRAFVADLEAAYRVMWRRWCDEQLRRPRA